MAEISTGEVKQLASLARLELNPEEVEGYKKDLAAIIHYVSQLQEAQISTEQRTIAVDLNKNQFRRDGEPHPGGIYTKILLAGAPQTEGDYLKVKAVFNNYGQ